MKHLKDGMGYEDFVQYSLRHLELNIVQMDTVKGVEDSKKTLLTLHFKKNVIFEGFCHALRFASK